MKSIPKWTKTGGAYYRGMRQHISTQKNTPFLASEIHAKCNDVVCASRFDENRKNNEFHVKWINFEWKPKDSQ